MVKFMRLLPLLIMLSGCSIFFGSSPGPKSAKKTEYQVNFTSKEWKIKEDNQSDYVYENIRDGRILLSNSFCKEFQDQPLEILASRTFRTVKNFKSFKNEYITLQEREAFRLEGQGQVDGVDVILRLVNTRRNNCYFDFVSITPVKNDPGNTDFDQFLSAVEFE